MATAIRGRGAAYDVRPARGWDAEYGGPIGGAVRSLTGLARGVLAGLFIFFGAVHLTGKADLIAPPDTALGQLHELVDQMSIGGLTGPIEVVVGLLLFLTVKETVSRALGLALVIVIVAGYASGYTLADMLSALSSLLRNAAGVLDNVAAQAA